MFLPRRISRFRTIAKRALEVIIAGPTLTPPGALHNFFGAEEAVAVAAHTSLGDDDSLGFRDFETQACLEHFVTGVGDDESRESPEDPLAGSADDEETNTKPEDILAGDGLDEDTQKCPGDILDNGCVFAGQTRDAEVHEVDVPAEQRDEASGAD